MLHKPHRRRLLGDQPGQTLLCMSGSKSVVGQQDYLVARPAALGRQTFGGATGRVRPATRVRHCLCEDNAMYDAWPGGLAGLRASSHLHIISNRAAPKLSRHFANRPVIYTPASTISDALARGEVSSKSAIFLPQEMVLRRDSPGPANAERKSRCRAGSKVSTLGRTGTRSRLARRIESFDPEPRPGCEAGWRAGAKVSPLSRVRQASSRTGEQQVARLTDLTLKYATLQRLQGAGATCVRYTRVAGCRW